MKMKMKRAVGTAWTATTATTAALPWTTNMNTSKTMTIKMTTSFMMRTLPCAWFSTPSSPSPSLPSSSPPPPRRPPSSSRGKNNSSSSRSRNSSSSSPPSSTPDSFSSSSSSPSSSSPSNLPLLLRVNSAHSLRAKFGDRIGDDFDLPSSDLEVLVPKLNISPKSEKIAEIEAIEKVKPNIDLSGRAFGIGRRKTSTCRVWLTPGTGEIFINKQKHSVYFERFEWLQQFLIPFEVTGTVGQFDVWAIAEGGGKTGQVGAARLGISRALAAYDPKYKIYLADFGLLTKDPRQVERKKYGRYKARRGYTYKRR